MKRFLDLPSDAIFVSVKRVIDDPSKALNLDAVNFAHSHDWISDWDFEFYTDTSRKRNTTDRQQCTREKINQKVIARMQGGPESDEAKPPCGPVWTLGPGAIRQAQAEGKITAWDAEFYLGNVLKDFVTARQLPIKRRIEAQVAGPAPALPRATEELVKWSCTVDQAKQAHAAGLVSAWEVRFVEEGVSKAWLSEKQLEIKRRIEEKTGSLQVVPAPGAAKSLWSCTEEAVKQALQEKRINEWEATFFGQNARKLELSDKQLDIKRRIEEKTAASRGVSVPSSTKPLWSPPPLMPSGQQSGKSLWSCTEEAVKQACQEKKINDWEANFFAQNSHKLVLSEKQLAVKSNIEKKINSRCVAVPAVPTATYMVSHS